MLKNEEQSIDGSNDDAQRHSIHIDLSLRVYSVATVGDDVTSITALQTPGVVRRFLLSVALQQKDGLARGQKSTYGRSCRLEFPLFRYNYWDYFPE